MRAEFDLSGLSVVLTSASGSAVAAFEAAWAPFRTDRPRGPRLLDVVLDETEDERLRAGPTAKEASCRVSPRGLELLTRGARGLVDHEGRGTIEIASGHDLFGFYAASNLLLAAVAWRLPGVGGVLVHGAGLVVDGRAFVLLGSAGTGKTTWAEGGKAEGAGFLSDDVVALRAGDDGVHALSFPFRANHPVPMPPGRWPLVAVLLPKWGAKAAIESASALRAHAAIEASVLYHDVLAGDPAVPRVLEAIASVPALGLVFSADGKSTPVLRAL